MQKTMFLLFSILFFNLSLQKINAMFFDLEDFNPQLGILSDPEDASVEYESMYSEKLENVIRNYPQISNEMARLSKERRDAINVQDLESIKRIDEKISGLNRLIRYNFKESLFLFLKSTCPIF
jgi:hypothetical protein